MSLRSGSGRSDDLAGSPKQPLASRASPQVARPEKSRAFTFGNEWNQSLDAATSSSPQPNLSSSPVFGFGSSGSGTGFSGLFAATQHDRSIPATPTKSISGSKGTNTSPTSIPSRSLCGIQASKVDSTSATSQPLFSFDSPTAQPKLHEPVSSSSNKSSVFSFGPGTTDNQVASSPTPPPPFRFSPKSPGSERLATLSTKPQTAPLFRLGSKSTTQGANIPSWSFQDLKPQFPAHHFGGTSSTNETANAPPHTRRSTEIFTSPEAKVEPVPYDVRDEKAPVHRFFSNDFQRILQNGMRVANRTVDAIEQPCRDMKDPSLHKLLDDAKELCTFHASDTKTIAVLGDSGEGKSSLINSLLHFPGIAKTGDIGSACTAVVTEYRQKSSNQIMPINIQVEYLSKSEIEDMVTELLWSYRQLYLPGVESDETSAKDYERYTRESAQAWSALEAAFKHKKDFNERFLQDMSEGASERVRDRLIEWSHAIDWPDSGVPGIWTSTATTAQECCEKTEIFMKDKYWPFTKVIRIYVDSYILTAGLVLADLPGLQDTNLARVRATQEYLMKCSNIFIVAKISRAITDQSLKSSLYSVLSQHMPLEWEESAAKALNIAVVCTKSEEINADTARREFCGSNKPISSATLSELDKSIQSAKDAGDRPRKKELKQSRELLFINARNDHVKRGLRAAYASKVPEGNLDVFCVSNVLYEKYSRKGNANLVQASGVPEVRKYCQKIMADTQLREARHFLQSSLLSLLNSLEMWTRSLVAQQQEKTVSKESAKSIRQMIASTAREASQNIREIRKEFIECFNEQISQLSENRYDKWEDAATREGRQWQSWHWSQYNAWCLNNGNHETPKRPREDWNAKIIWKMRSELDYQWDLVEDEIPTIFEDLFENLEFLLEKLKKTMLNLTPDEMHDVISTGLDSRIKSVEYKLKLAEEKFAGEIRFTRRCASESNYNSYILTEMIPTYRSASSISGTGKAARQRSIVQGRITDESLFPTVCVAISDRIRSLAKQNEKRLLKIFGEVIQRTQEDIEFALKSRGQKGLKRADEASADLIVLEKIRQLRVEAEAIGRESETD